MNEINIQKTAQIVKNAFLEYSIDIHYYLIYYILRIAYGFECLVAKICNQMINLNHRMKKLLRFGIDCLYHKTMRYLFLHKNILH